MTLSPKIKGLIIGAAFLLIAIIVAVVVLVVKQKNDVVKAESISFEIANENMLVGEEKEFGISIYPNNTANKTINYRSSNSSIIEIVSARNGKITIRAKAIGEANIIATSVSNKKLTDTCHVIVTDNVANAINVQASSTSTVGERTVVPIVLEPANANYQMLTIVSYNDQYISHPEIEIADDGARLVYTPIASGTSQLVIGINAQQGNNSLIVLTKQIEIVVENPVVSNFGFIVKSLNNQEFSEQEPKFLVDNGDVLTYIFNYEYDTGATGQAEDVHFTFNEQIFGISKSGLEYSITVKSNDWSLANIVVEYQGYNKTLSFVRGKIPATFNNDVLDSHNLTAGNNYQVKVTTEIGKLIENGFAHLELDNAYTEISLNGYILTCNESASNLHVGLVLVIDYWDNVITALQNDFVINITSSGYIEG